MKIGYSQLAANLEKFPFYLLIGAVVLLRGFLQDSLWLDETISWWVVKDGVPQTIARSIEYQGQSPFYYLLLLGVTKLAGTSETALRVLSLTALAAGCAVLYRLTILFISREAASLALVFFISSDGVLKALSARPYALALLLSMAATLMLLLWLEKNTPIYLLCYTLLLVLTFYAHYLFLLVVTLHLLCMVMRIHSLSRRQISLFAAAMLLSLLCCIPCIAQLGSLLARRSTLAFIPGQNAWGLIGALVPASTAVYLAAALMMAVLFSPGTKEPIRLGRPGRLTRGRLIELLFWWIFPALFFYCFSLLSGNWMFVDRYYLWSAPAAALLAAGLVYSINPPAARRIAVLVVCMLVLVRESDRRWVSEDWRRAAEIVTEQTRGVRQPVLLYSGLVEADSTQWLKDPAKAEYLRAPFSYYPIPVQALLLPSSMEDGEAAGYFEAQLAPELAASKEFLLVSLRRKILAGGKQLPADQYYRDFFSAAGYKAEPLLEKGAVRVLKFSIGG